MDDPRHVLPQRQRGDRPLWLGQDARLSAPQGPHAHPATGDDPPERWPLDQLLAWEEKRIALAESALESLVAPTREEVGLTGLLPQPKPRRAG